MDIYEAIVHTSAIDVLPRGATVKGIDLIPYEFNREIELSWLTVKLANGVNRDVLVTSPKKVGEVEEDNVCNNDAVRDQEQHVRTSLSESTDTGCSAREVEQVQCEEERTLPVRPSEHGSSD